MRGDEPNLIHAIHTIIVSWGNFGRQFSCMKISRGPNNNLARVIIRAQPQNLVTQWPQRKIFAHCKPISRRELFWQGGAAGA